MHQAAQKAVSGACRASAVCRCPDNAIQSGELRRREVPLFRPVPPRKSGNSPASPPLPVGRGAGCRERKICDLKRGSVAVRAELVAILRLDEAERACFQSLSLAVQVMSSPAFFNPENLGKIMAVHDNRRCRPANRAGKMPFLSDINDGIPPNHLHSKMSFLCTFLSWGELYTDRHLPQCLNHEFHLALPTQADLDRS